MNRFIAKYLLYYPVIFLKNEHVAKHLQTYERFQWLTIENIKQHQFHALTKLLHHTYYNFPFYHELYTKHGISPGDIKTISDLKYLPFLEKKDLIELSSSITTDNFWRISRKTTGGSTGQAVTILKNTDALARERAATWRAYRWASIDIGESQARFWGDPLTIGNKFKYKLIDFIANRKRLSAFGINDESLELYYRAICRFKPAYFYGYVSILSEFAEFITRKAYTLPRSLKCVITTSEVLDETSRQYIQTIFKLPVFNEYGCGEVGSIAHECDMGSMHIMSDNMICEIISENGNPAHTGELVVTDLYNYAMPLIRYRLQDFATSSQSSCTCGRGLPVISKIHGRAYDMLIDRSGKKHHPEIIMYIFEEIKKKGLTITQFQVLQTDIDTIDVRLVKPMGKCNNIEELIRKEIHERVSSDFNIKFHNVDHIEREPSGKLRLVKNLYMPPNQQ